MDTDNKAPKVCTSGFQTIHIPVNGYPFIKSFIKKGMIAAMSFVKMRQNAPKNKKNGAKQ